MAPQAGSGLGVLFAAVLGRESTRSGGEKRLDEDGEGEGAGEEASYCGG